MDMKDAHIGIQVADLTRACELLNRLLGLTFAEPIRGWPIQVRIGEEIEHSEGRFTVSRQGPPYLEVTENRAGSKIWHSDGRELGLPPPRVLGRGRRGRRPAADRGRIPGGSWGPERRGRV